LSFLYEARYCFKILNKFDALERLIKPLQFPEPIQQQLADAARQRHRRLLRAGLRVMLGNGACIASMIVVCTALDDATRVPILFIGIGFAMFSGIAFLYLIFHVTIGRFVPALRWSGGAVLLLLACFPWLYLMMLPILYFFVPKP